ncbi:MAG: chaperone modulator CbpM [Saprospiraceae bacterium]|nr:chaperone modulator CbpM [Saprospiraceae bacterium]
MVNNNFVLAEKFCTHHDIEISFINSLGEYGLVDVIAFENSLYLANDSLHNIEKMMRLHFDLGVNIEGIEVIENLLQQIQTLHHELKAANNKLKLFDND